MVARFHFLVVNRLLNARAVRIESPVQALLQLGVDRVFRWVSLLVISGSDNCPAGYLGFALQRARACEIVAQQYGNNAPMAYMAGLLSTLDSILSAPLPDIIQPLPLDAGFKRAILKREGDLGAILEAVLGYEAGNFNAAAQHGFSIQHVQSAFWEAAAYSARMIADLKVVAGSEVP